MTMKLLPLRALALLLAFAAVTHAGPIHEAVMDRDLDQIRVLLQLDPKLVNQPNAAGDPPLYIAIYRGDRAVVGLLLTNRAAVNLPPNVRGETPLSIAVELGHKSVAAMLRKAGAQETPASRGAAIRYQATRRTPEELPALLTAHPQLVDARDGRGNTALYLAAFLGNAEAVTMLLVAKADPNATNNAGGTPYSIALERSRTELATLLRQAGGRENKITESLPFRQAARSGAAEQVRALLQQRPEFINVRDDLERTALHEAALAGHTNVAALLLNQPALDQLEAGRISAYVTALLSEPKAAVDARDFSRSTPLIQAAGADRRAMVALLLAHGAEVNAFTRQETTALLTASARGHLAVVQLLLARGADLTLADNLGYTALHWAAANGHREIAELLLARKASLRVIDNRGNTPIHIASSRGRREVVAALIAAQAEVNRPNKDGFTPLKLAMRSNHKEVIELLQQHGGKE